MCYIISHFEFKSKNEILVEGYGERNNTLLHPFGSTDAEKEVKNEFETT